MGYQYATSANGFSPEEIQRGYERGKDVKDHYHNERNKYVQARDTYNQREEDRVASLTGDELAKYNSQQQAQQAKSKALKDSRNAQRAEKDRIRSTWTPEQHAANEKRISDTRAKIDARKEASKAKNVAEYKALTPQERDIKAQQKKDFWTRIYSRRSKKYGGYDMNSEAPSSTPAVTQQPQQPQQVQEPTDNDRFAASDKFREELDSAKTSFSGGKYESNIEQDLNKGRERADGFINTNNWDRQSDREKQFKLNSENTQNSVDFYKKYHFLNKDAQKGNSDGSQIANKYISQAAQTNPLDVVELDKHIRKGPMYHEAKSEVAGLLTYGDKYRNSRENPMTWNQPNPMEGFEPPDFQSIYKQSKKDIDSIKL